MTYMMYLRWFNSFLLLIILIGLFFIIGGNLINLIIAVTLLTIAMDYIEEYLTIKNKFNR
ncbi:hypothetical protein [Clostridium sp. UBA1056]|uniref:hypothetical protein n=1 Tax=unclassified Clostridium TaxID=2614128 RepID=UPI003216BDD9